MASTRMSAPMRGVTSQLNRLSISTPTARTITTSPSSLASVSSITTSVNAPPTILPFEERTVNATIHHFPSLEPLRFEAYPANHLLLPTRRDILHRAVIFEGDAKRLGTASTKWRSEVHGSARKIRPQKGSGRARLGDKKSPMLRGGGVAFGPKPRDFSSGLQKKVYDLAWRTALSYRFKQGELVIVDNALEIEAPSSSLLQYIFKKNKWGQRDGRSVLVTLEDRPLLAKALAETPKEGWTCTWEDVDVKDLLSTGRIVIERKALQNIFLSHQEDIVRSEFSPKLAKHDPPMDLQRVLGWTEFRRLETAQPDQHAILEPLMYERLANKRFALAEVAEKQEATNLLISANELKSEALRVQAETLSRHKDLELETEEEESLRITGLQKRIELLLLHADRSDFKAASLRLQLDDKLADEWEEDAEHYRVAAAEKQMEIDEIMGVESAEDAEVEEAEAEVEEQKKR